MKKLIPIYLILSIIVAVWFVISRNFIPIYIYGVMTFIVITILIIEYKKTKL
jgi:hypothetical protein